MFTFRMHADYGLGSFIGVDGAEHTPGNTWGHLQTDPVMLTAGDHEFEALGFEDCCDGHAELEVAVVCWCGRRARTGNSTAWHHRQTTRGSRDKRARASSGRHPRTQHCTQLSLMHTASSRRLTEPVAN